jgi:hypothetical protein
MRLALAAREGAASDPAPCERRPRLSFRARPYQRAQNPLEARGATERTHRQNKMKQFLKLLILLPLAVAILAVAEANRHSVSIYLDPFAGASPEGTQITLPLFAVILIGIMIGVVFGSAVTYFEQGRHRRAARLARADADSLRAELARLSRTRPGEKGKA